MTASTTKLTKLPLTVEISSWTHFIEKLAEEPFRSPLYIWRGQASADWPLTSSFDRWLSAAGKEQDAETMAVKHLNRFRSACRGRRGPNPAAFSDDAEAWALAQHNNMKTPLLDWTESPYIALFFAFEKLLETSGPRAIWAYYLPSVFKRFTEGKDADDKSTRGERGGTGGRVLTPIRPAQNDNLRLLSQAGLFTQVPLGRNFDEWISENASLDQRVPALVKFVIPNRSRSACLRALNRMNINHMSLFPDLYGAGTYCNLALAIDEYSE